MYRLLDLYKMPHNPKQPLVCMDEKSKQLLGNNRQPIAAKPGSPEKYDYEYKRKGTCNIFVAVASKAGKHIVKVTDTRDEGRFCIFHRRLGRKPFSRCGIYTDRVRQLKYAF